MIENRHERLLRSFRPESHVGDAVECRSGIGGGEGLGCGEPGFRFENAAASVLGLAVLLYAILDAAPLVRRGAGISPTTVEQARTLFRANDPRNLLAVHATVNLSKGDRTPGEWAPSTGSGRCLYAERYVAVAAAYGLPVTPADRAALAVDLRACA